MLCQPLSLTGFLPDLPGVVAWAAVLFERLLLLRHHDHQLVVSLSYDLVMSVLLGVVCHIKGEPLKWRWGGDSE